MRQAYFRYVIKMEIRTSYRRGELCMFESCKCIWVIEYLGMKENPVQWVQIFPWGFFVCDTYLQGWPSVVFFKYSGSLHPLCIHVCAACCVCVCIWGPPKKVLVHTCMLYEKCFKPTLMGKCAIQMHCVIIIKTNYLCIPCSNSLAILYKFTVHVCLYKSCLFGYICMCVCGLYNRCTESYFYVWVQNI